ncbi:hypothetical protein TNCV_3347041 [Trichonephila clavipes]|nr:hypothetical protein TNCV_3347041 [Trichonephila clavipes]
MDGMQMYTVLSQEKTTSPYFQGVYSRDTLPPLEENMCAIVNSDDSSQPGTHWFNILKENWGRWKQHSRTLIGSFMARRELSCFDPGAIGRVVVYRAFTPQVLGSINGLGKVDSAFIPDALGR